MKDSSLAAKDQKRVKEHMQKHKVPFEQACKALGLTPEVRKGGKKPKLGRHAGVSH